MPTKRVFPLRNRAMLRKVRQTGDANFALLDVLTTDTVFFRDDFISDINPATGPWALGGAGTPTGAVQTVTNGAVDLVTTNTSADAAILYLGTKPLTADQNPVFSTRLYTTSIANVKLEVGFSDSGAAGVLGASGVGIVNALHDEGGSATTLTSGASDCACAIMDTASDATNPTYWKLMAAKGGTVTVKNPSTSVPAANIAPVASTFQDIVIYLERSPIASEEVAVGLIVNGQQLTYTASGGPTYTAQLFPYVMILTRTTAAKTMRNDYFDLVWDRVAGR